jgi:prefoldin subunit 5
MENHLITDVENLNRIQLLINKNESLEIMKQENLEILKFAEEVNHNLTKQVFIPICENLAYFVGNIINTNECKVYLGGDYFVNTTNFRAIKILENRKNRLDILIEQNKKEIGSVLPQTESNNKIFQNKTYAPISIDNTPKIGSSLEKNLKKLDDDTFEIIEDIEDKEGIDSSKVIAYSDIKHNPNNNEEQKIFLNEKLKKLIQTKNCVESNNQGSFESLLLKPNIRNNKESLLNSMVSNKKSLENIKNKVVISINPKFSNPSSVEIQSNKDKMNLETIKRSKFFEDNEI